MKAFFCKLLSRKPSKLQDVLSRLDVALADNQRAIDSLLEEVRKL